MRQPSVRALGLARARAGGRNAHIGLLDQPHKLTAQARRAHLLFSRTYRTRRLHPLGPRMFSGPGSGIKNVSNDMGLTRISETRDRIAPWIQLC